MFYCCIVHWHVSQISFVNMQPCSTTYIGCAHRALFLFSVHYDVLICLTCCFSTQLRWQSAALAHVPWQKQSDLHRAQRTLLQCDWHLPPRGLQVPRRAHRGVWHCLGQAGRGGDAKSGDFLCLPSFQGGSPRRGQEVLRHRLGRWDRCCLRTSPAACTYNIHLKIHTHIYKCCHLVFTLLTYLKILFFSETMQ